ncbi:MAG: exosortase K [Desulfobulbaceae bacterium A2]|nr:MAG: exosortase K [Desulfobulbaceae bacterium A2]
MMNISAPDTSRAGRVADLALLGLSLALVCGLKFHLSRATSDELGWLLGPLARVVGVLSGYAFHAESGAGYVREDGLLVIAPVCGGGNFLLAILLVAIGTVFVNPASPGRRLRRLAAAAGAAVLFALVINALRVTLAITCYDLHLSWGWLTSSRLHRLSGVLLFFPALLAYGLLVQRMIAGCRQGRVLPLCLGAYLGVALAMPLLNGAGRNAGTGVLEHALTLLLGCAFCVGIFLVFQAGRRKCGRTGRTEQGTLSLSA